MQSTTNINKVTNDYKEIGEDEKNEDSLVYENKLLETGQRSQSQEKVNYKESGSLSTIYLLDLPYLDVSRGMVKPVSDTLMVVCIATRLLLLCRARVKVTIVAFQSAPEGMHPSAREVGAVYIVRIFVTNLKVTEIPMQRHFSLSVLWSGI